MGTNSLAFKEVTIDLLEPGVVLSSAVYGKDHVMLIAPGIPIRDRMLQRLKSHGLQSVLVGKDDYAKLTSTALRNTANIHICGGCRTPLPLNLTKDDVSPTWVCTKCRARYRGHLDLESSKQLIDRVRIAKFPISKRLFANQTKVAKSIDFLVSPRYDGPERRATSRMAIAVPVAGIPVDEYFRPVGPPLVLTTRNISTGGIALIHDQPLVPKFLIVGLPTAPDTENVQLVVEVLRCRSIGPTFEIAGKFVMNAVD